MNEITLLLIVAITLSTWILFIIITLTIADLQAIALEKALRRHPYARKWRGVTKLRKQIELHSDDKKVSRAAIRLAFARFQANPSLGFVELLPVVTFPQTTRQFFAVYQTFALAPFVKLRAVMHIRSGEPRWPTYVRSSPKKAWPSRLYALLSWLLSVMNLLLATYVSFIATLGETTYLLVYLGIFILWLAWSISSYPAVAIRQKIALIFLAPASLGYFFVRATMAPFRPMTLAFQPLIRAWSRSTKSV